MRFHVLSNPNIQTTKAYCLDGYASIIPTFTKLLKSLGHEVLLYASEENEAECDELICCITKKEQEARFNGCAYNYVKVDANEPLWRLWNPRAIVEVGKRKQPGDFLCSISGNMNKPVLDAHKDLMGVEWSIGYCGSFAPFRVFESEAWRYMNYGREGKWNGVFMDAVIPAFFNKDLWKFRAEKEPFALFVGRHIESKGLRIAVAACQAAGIPLKTIGHGDLNMAEGAECLGTLPMDERNDLMSRASCVIAPTIFIEPFNMVVVEAQLCGTPVVTTDFGGFTETVEQGKTGFRCSYIGEFARGIHDCFKLDREYVRDRAVAKYSIEAVAPQYQRYFDRINLLWKDGFNTV